MLIDISLVNDFDNFSTNGKFCFFFSGVGGVGVGVGERNCQGPAPRTIILESGATKLLKVNQTEIQNHLLIIIFV